MDLKYDHVLGVEIWTEPQRPDETHLDYTKRVLTAAGYQFVVNADGSETVIRPNGTVAFTARKKWLDVLANEAYRGCSRVFF